MPATLLVKTPLPLPYTYLGGVVTMAALDNVNGNYFISTSSEIVLCFNINVTTPHNLTISGQNDPQNRSKDIVIAVPAHASSTTGFVISQKIPATGFADSNNQVQLPTGQNAELIVGVISGT